MRIQLPVLVIVVLILIGCKKESVNPPASSTAVYSINCSATTIQGNYIVGTPLGISNAITLQVNVTQAGNYTLSTATVNGMKFSAGGTFSATGTATISLSAIGTPTTSGITSFTLTAGSSSCTVNINVSLPANPILTDNDHMLFGNPSKAAAITDSINNYLMRKTYYAVSYSEGRGTPNWVSWHLFTDDIGATPRQNDFRPDNTLPAGWYQVQSDAYSGSGFDRGHNCPSADRTSSVDANSSTFLMTNMIPQAPLMNQQTWAIMEDSLRRLVSLGNEIYIIMGSYGAGGTGTNGFATTVNGGHVTVPATVWKVALVIPNGNNDSSRVDATSRLIAVSISNANNSTGSWKNYRTSVDAIEAATGYNLFDRLTVALQAVLEARVDNL